MKLYRQLATIMAVLALLASGAASSVTATTFVVDPGLSSSMPFGPDGAMYFSDCGLARIFRIDLQGHATVIAGSGPGMFDNGFSGDGGPAIDAHFGCPLGLQFDATGALLVDDHLNDRIRKIGLDGIVETIVGSGRGAITDWAPKTDHGFVNADDGKTALKVSLNSPVGITYDAHGNLYIADRDHNALRKVDTNGIVTTIAGTGKAGFSGDGGPATRAQLDYPLFIVFDRAGNLFFTDDSNQRIRRIDTHGIITTIAGNGEMGDAGDGGPAVDAQLQNPVDLGFGPDGSLYVTESEVFRVRRIDTHGIIWPVAGNGQEGCSGYGGPATAMQLDGPGSLTFDSRGNLYIEDVGCAVIIKVDATGKSRIFAAAP